jgi:four helix bundle protein
VPFKTGIKCRFKCGDGAMAELFGHEKLIVYQKGMQFAVVRGALLAELPKRVAACDHLARGAESILVNIAHASNLWSPKERIVYLGHANGSSLECAACLDVFVAKGLLSADDASPGKHLLSEIVSILVTMRKTTTNRVREEHSTYRTKNGRLFSHEDLDVYEASLQLSAWVERMLAEFSCSADLLSKLDKATTAIPLNIAEGTGRFSGTDQAKFFGIAYKAAIQSSALVDLAVVSASADPSRVEEGRKLLRGIAAMLTSLSKVASDEN